MNKGSSDIRTDPSSYRDPSGFIFWAGGECYRQVNPVYKAHYDQLIQSGLYATLTESQQLIPHTEVNASFPGLPDSYKILKPDQLAFISYPWEWNFDQLKEAALLTLDIAQTALKHEMVLKDATPFNTQWHQGKMIFIDTLSFEQYTEGKPWVAYRQFCECFLSPLLLMHYTQQSLPAFQLAYPEGIPLSLTSKLLPRRSRWSVFTYLHIHLHAKYALKKENAAEKNTVLPKKKLMSLLSSLQTLIQPLKTPDSASVWGEYYAEAETRGEYLDTKKKLTREWLQLALPYKTVTDFGANDGLFSKMAAENGAYVLALDADIKALTHLCTSIRKEKTTNILPLCADLSNPAPATGFNNAERKSLKDRIAGRDLGLALALIHHLCIGKSIPLTAVAEFFSASCKKLIIEWVPLTDPKAAQVASHKSIEYKNYTETDFENAFGRHFKTLKKQAVRGSERILYLMERI